MRPLLLVTQSCTLLLALLLGLAGPSLAQERGTTERTIESSGKEREFLLHVPRSYKKDVRKGPVPLVVMLHGRTGSGKIAASGYYGWKELSEKEGFVVAFPSALGRPTSWEGAWRGKPTEDSIFLAEMIDLVLEELEIDEDRVFMTGHSSGGFMSFSFATTHASKVAAIAPVAGLVVNRSKPALPVSVLSIHGMDDDVVPYGKGRWGTPSAPESAELFAQHNGCGPVERTELKKGRVLCDRWTDGRAETEVVFYSIEGGDHGWPQGGSRSVAATKLIWEFFEAHPRKAEEPEEGRGAEGGKSEKGRTNEDDDRP